MTEQSSAKREFLLALTATVAGLGASAAGAQSQSIAPATPDVKAVQGKTVPHKHNPANPPQMAKPKQALQSRAVAPKPVRGGATKPVADKFP